MKRWLSQFMLDEVASYFIYRHRHLDKAARAQMLKSGVYAVDFLRRSSLILSFQMATVAIFMLSLLSLLACLVTQWVLYRSIANFESLLFLGLLTIMSFGLFLNYYREKTWMRATGIKAKIEALTRASVDPKLDDAKNREFAAANSKKKKATYRELEELIEKKVLEALLAQTVVQSQQEINQEIKQEIKQELN